MADASNFVSYQSVESIFPFFVDPSERQVLNSTALANPNAIGQGVTFRDRFRLGEREIELMCEIAAFVPNQSLTIVGIADSLRMTVTFDVEHIDGNIRLNQTTNLEYANALTKLISPLVGGRLSRQAEVYFERLKRFGVNIIVRGSLPEAI